VPQRHIATYSAYNNAGKGNERGLGLLAYYTMQNFGYFVLSILKLN